MRLSFAPFTLDLDTRQLMRNGREVHLSPKAFELLAALASERPKALSKAHLQERLWPDTFVTDASLSNLVAEVRRALGDRGSKPRWIRTSHGFGYAFCGEALPSSAERADPGGTPSCWLEWGRSRFFLRIGEHVIGRDSDVDVRIDASSVSRRHARLMVRADGAWLEDFGSKNGTRRGEQRVTAPVQLADGDAIHIGAVRLTFRSRTAIGSTETLAETVT